MSRHGLLLVLLLLWPALLPAGTDRPPAGLRSVQARFTQEKHLPILAKPLLSQGSFAFQAPGSLRWEYTAPLHSLLLLHQGRIGKWIDQDGALVPDTNPGVEALRLVLEDLGSWLDGRFTDNPQFAARRIGEHRVELTPKDQGMAAVISQIELELDRSQGVVEQVTIHEGPDALTRLRFTDIVLNRPIPATVFSGP